MSDERDVVHVYKNKQAWEWHDLYQAAQKRYEDQCTGTMTRLQRIQKLEQQLATLRQQVWEEAAKRIDYYNDEPGHFDPHLQHIVDWMREQAKKGTR